MPDKKVYFVLFIILIVFFFVMFLTFGVRNIQENEFSSVIVVGDDTTWIFNNRRWVNIRSSVSKKQMDGENFHIFDDNKEIGTYNIRYDERTWKVFDKSEKEVPINGNLLAFRGNYQLRVKKFQESKVTDYTYVKQVLSENGLSTNSKFTSISMVSIDYDGDSKEEDFYVISNAFPLDFETDNTFSIAFMVKDESIHYLYTDVTSVSSLNACKPYYRAFLDINYDNVYEVILSCGRYSASDRVDMLYHAEKDDFKLLISNQ